MKIHIDNNTNRQNRVSSYTIGQIFVNDECFSKSLLLLPNKIIQNWRPKNIIELEKEDFHSIIAEKPELVLLGTGNQVVYPSADIIALVESKGIGLELMDTGAACRSFNILASEDRNILAALFMLEGN